MIAVCRSRAVLGYDVQCGDVGVADGVYGQSETGRGRVVGDPEDVLSARSVQDHVQVDDGDDVVTGASSLAGIVFAAVQPLLLASEADEPDRVVEVIARHHSGGFDDGSRAAGVVVGAWGVGLGARGCRVQMAADYDYVGGGSGAGQLADDVLAVVGAHAEVLESAGRPESRDRRQNPFGCAVVVVGAGVAGLIVLEVLDVGLEGGFADGCDHRGDVVFHAVVLRSHYGDRSLQHGEAQRLNEQHARQHGVRGGAVTADYRYAIPDEKDVPQLGSGQAAFRRRQMDHRIVVDRPEGRVENRSEGDVGGGRGFADPYGPVRVDVAEVEILCPFLCVEFPRARLEQDQGIGGHGYGGDGKQHEYCLQHASTPVRIGVHCKQR